MPTYELSTDAITNFLAAIDRAGCGIHRAESEFNEAANQMNVAFVGSDIWSPVALGVETMAALTPSASNFKTTMRNPNAILSGLVSEALGRFQSILPYAEGLPSTGILTIEQLLSSYNQGGSMQTWYASGPGLRLAMESINALDLKRWNYCYPVSPDKGNYLARVLLGVFGAGNIEIDTTRYRGVGLNYYWPTVYGGTPYTAIVTATIYDPATDTLVPNKTFTTGIVSTGSPTFNSMGQLNPGGPTPAPAGSNIVSIQNVTGVHAASSIYFGGIGGAGVWE